MTLADAIENAERWQLQPELLVSPRDLKSAVFALSAELKRRNAAKVAYRQNNPLGGPARIFEAMASRIRAGEEFYAVLADYGLSLNDKGGGCADDE